MNSKALFYLFSFCFILFFVIPVFAQIPTQLNNYRYLQPMHETTVSITQALASQGDMASDGSGHHYVAPNSSGSITHYLFDNVGTLLSSTSFGTTSSAKPAITARNGLLHVALHNANSNRIELYQSADGGSNWTTGSVPFRDVQGTLDGLDAFEDDRGVHITYSSSTGIYYHMRNLATNDWATYASTVYSGTLGGNISPAITTSGSVGDDSAHVLSQLGMFSIYLNTTNGGAWVPSTGPYLSSSHNSFTVVRNGTSLANYGPYMFVFSHPPGLPDPQGFTRRYRKYDTTNPWGGPLGVQTGVPNSKPSVVISPGYPDTDIDWPNFVYSDIASDQYYQVVLFRMKSTDSQPGVFGPVNVNELAPNVFVHGSESVAGANQGSVVVMWRGRDDNKLYFRRKPYAIVGNMNENYTLRDTNWIVGVCTLAAGKELRLKSGSITIVLGQFLYGTIYEPGKIALGNGASLVVESGARLILQAPQFPSYPSGGTIECGSGATITVESGGIVEANAGSKLYFGTNSSLVVDGTFIANGTSTKQVVLTRSATSEKWEGIDATNAEALPSITMSNTSISFCDAGISIHKDGTMNMDQCTVTDAGIGVHIVPSGNPLGDQPTYSFAITSSHFTNIGSYGLLVDNTSSLLAMYNTITGTAPNEAIGVQCINASPLFLHNHIENCFIGLWCVSGSSPEFENGLNGGYNFIQNNKIGVRCENESHAVLGFDSGHMSDEGGQNTINQNGDYDVALIDKSIVAAEENHWSYDEDPPGVFSIEDGSALDYDPWLPPGDKPSGLVVGTGMEGDSIPFISPFSPVMREALAKRGEGEYQQAIALLKAIIEDQMSPLNAKRWAIGQLLAVAQRVSRANISNYLVGLLGSQTGLERHIRTVLPACYLNDGSWSLALATFEANIHEYPRTGLESGGIYGKFLYALYRTRDIALASQLVDLLNTRFPNSAKALAARAVFQKYASASSDAPHAEAPQDGVHGSVLKTQASLPAVYDLHDNYPNPFNPSTTISYDLPIDSKVTLKVFDMLGREVATLVDGFAKAGYHQATLNATNLASGLYFYRMQAGSFISVKKMVLVK